MGVFLLAPNAFRIWNSDKKKKVEDKNYLTIGRPCILNQIK